MNEHANDPTLNAARDTPERIGRLEEITVARPRCDGVRLSKYRSISDQGDGSALWWVRCRNARCAHRFRVLLE